MPDTSVAPWLFEGTGIENGDTLGEEVGGFGIEIDTTTPLSPPGTKVLAVIPNLFGPGLHAEMAYYETAAGARVFSAGVLDFPAVLLHPAGMRLMDNLWRHMLAGPEDEDEPPSRSRPPDRLRGRARRLAAPERDREERQRREELARGDEEEHRAAAPTTRAAARRRRSRAGRRASPS